MATTRVLLFKGDAGAGHRVERSEPSVQPFLAGVRVTVTELVELVLVL